MGKILSIIVPAYNMEKYLGYCLSSIERIRKDFLSGIEVLVIDDGSSDRTFDIASKYSRKYPDSFFVVSKENGGHGSAVNAGIHKAKGKYCKVLDGDDWLNTRVLTGFLKLLATCDADIVASDYLCVKDRTGEILSRKSCTDDASQYGKICSIKKGEVKKVIKMHSLTIKTVFLKNMPKLDEHCFYVDTEYMTYPALDAESVYYTPACIYMYRLGRNGQSVDIKSMQKNRMQHIRVFQSLTAFYASLDARGVVPNTKRYIEKCIAQVAENQFQIYISMGLQKGIREELRAWDCRLKKEYPGIYKSVAKKSIVLLRISNYRLLGLAALAYKIIKG